MRHRPPEIYGLPQTNEIEGRFNRTLEDMMSVYKAGDPDNWDAVFPFVM